VTFCRAGSDACFDAAFALQGEFLRAIVMLNVFHHIPSAGRFLQTPSGVQRGRVVVMIEPWITVWSHLIYKLFHHETRTFRSQADFESTGPLPG
jgi:hypothetical protein